MPEDRTELLEALAAEIRECTKCRLYEGTTNGVPGAGAVNAEIMFIGEGPGFHEDKQGLPFVGPSGKYLDTLLKLVGMHRDQVFIANVVKHRPPENRDPQPDEIIACKPYLDKQVEIIDPLVIVTLGRFSMARYFPGAKISAIHGQPKFDGARAYLPLFHPAAVLRNVNLVKEMEADFKRIPELITKVKALRAAGSAPASPNGEPPPTQNGSEPPKQLKLF